MVRKSTNEFIKKEDICIIKINTPKYGLIETIIDIEDYEKVKDIYWTVRKNQKLFYIEHSYSENNKRKRLHLHRYLANCSSDKVVDHIDGNSLNNRKINLRCVSQRVNCQNKHNSKNIYKQKDIYYVMFCVNGKNKCLCFTRDIKEAEKYAKYGRILIKQGKIEELLNLNVKKVGLFKNNKSGYTGVQKSKYNKYQVYFKSKYIASFNDYEIACKCRKIAEKDNTELLTKFINKHKNILGQGKHNRMLTYNNETHSITEWSKITGISKSAILWRLNKLKWNVEDTLITPVRGIRKSEKI